jgi:hypothetical protein
MLRNAEHTPEYAVALCKWYQKTVLKDVMVTGSLCLHSLLFEITLFAEDATAHFKDSLKAFAANFGVFTESFDAGILDLVFDLLPSTAKSSNFRFLSKIGGSGRAKGGLTVGDSLADAEDIRPCEIRRAHSNFLGNWVDIGDFIDVGCGSSTKQRENPLWDRLVARDKTFGSQLEMSQLGITVFTHAMSKQLTIPVLGSTDREIVSTPTTWVDLSFHGQYLRQFAVDTSSHE